MTAGYSAESLKEKLGIKENFKIVILNPPKGYVETLGKRLEDAVAIQTLEHPVDLIQYFSLESRKLKSKFPILKNALASNGALWVCWPKVSSRVKTDLNENLVREIGLENGLVDVKVIAIDKVWSGLKFVQRKRDR